jgi:hypothetical protein
LISQHFIKEINPNILSTLRLYISNFRKQKQFWGVVIFFTTNFLFAQVQWKVDTTRIRIGEQILYEISTPSQSKVQFPQLKLDSLKHLEIVQDFPIDTLKNRLYKKYLLTSFDSGQYTIPAQEVFISNQRFLTDSILIQVGTVAVDTTKQGLFPIKPIYKAPPKTWHEYLYLLWWLLGILILVGLIWWLAFRSKKMIQWKPKVVLTPFDIALNQLKALDEKNLIGQQKIKEYYTELTDIVRNYIEQDVKISAMEITSDELIRILKKTNKYKKLGISRDQINHLELFLHNADLVKFAKAKPEMETLRSDRNFAEIVLKELKTVVSKPELDENGNPIVQMQKEEIQVKTTRKRRMTGLAIGLAILFFVGGATVWYYGIQYVKDTIVGHPSKELLEGNWYRNSYGYPAVSMESPVVLKAIELPFPEQVKQQALSLSNFAYGSLMSDFYILVMTMEFNPQIEFDMEKGLQGAVSTIQMNKGVTDMKYDFVDTQLDGLEGKEIIGTLKANGKDMIYHQYMFNNGNDIQQIMVVRTRGDAYAEKIEKRMVESIKLERIEE